MKKTLVLLLAIWLCGICGAQAAQLNKVAAVVNGQVITMFDLQKAAMPELARARLNPNNPKQARDVDKVFRKVLDMMIMDILLGQEAKRLKVSVSPAEVDNEIAKMMKARNLTRPQFEAQLAQQKISISEIRENFEKSLLRQKIMGMEVGRKVVVTPAEIKEYYEAHKDSLYERSGLHMGVLVYAPNVNARSIAAQIKSGKLTFKEAAAKYSIAPNRDKGGDMGPVEWDRLNPEWEGRLARMKPGDVTELFDLHGRTSSGAAGSGQRTAASILLRNGSGPAAARTSNSRWSRPRRRLTPFCVSPRPLSDLRSMPVNCGARPSLISGCKSPRCVRRV